MSGNGLCLEGVTYGGGFVQGGFVWTGFCPRTVGPIYHPKHQPSRGGPAPGSKIRDP